MKRFHFVHVLALACALTLVSILSGCGGGSSSAGGPPANSITSISVGIPCPPGMICRNPGGPPTAFLKVGLTGAFSVVAVLKDGTTRDITSEVNWNSTDPAVATVATSGLATGLSGGTVTVTATLGSLSNSKTLTIIPPLTILL